MMRAEYDADADALYLHLTNANATRTIEIDGNTNVDLDADGGLIGIEVLDPDRLWPLPEIMKRWAIGPDDALMLMAYCPFRCVMALAAPLPTG
jgi:uncharacterized protein YuzE